MHVCLVIDLITAIFLLHGLRYSDTRLRKQLCLGSLVYLGFISIRTYVFYAGYFGLFQRHPSLTTRGLDFLLQFFGGFWMLFGVIVLAKGVSWIVMAFAIHASVQWFTKPGRDGDRLLAPNFNQTLVKSPPVQD